METDDPYVVGKIVEGTVKSFAPFGAFIEIYPEKLCLLHVSQISREPNVQPWDVMAVGDVRDFRISHVDHKPGGPNIRLSLLGIETPNQE